MEDAASRIVDHYERHALEWYADRRAASWIDKPYIERFLRFLPERANILDLGCGGGLPIAAHLVAQGFRVTGIDSSPTLISLCRKRMPVQEWIVGDMRSLTLIGDLTEYWLGTASFTSATKIRRRCFPSSRHTPYRALF